MRIRVKLEVQINDEPATEREIFMGSDDYPAPEEVAPLTVGAVVLALNEELSEPLGGKQVFPERHPQVWEDPVGYRILAERAKELTPNKGLRDPPG